MMYQSANRKTAIKLARKLFSSDEFAAWVKADAAWDKADAAWDKARAAWVKAGAAWDKADAAWVKARAAWVKADAARVKARGTITTHQTIPVWGESRAFNIKASDRTGVYCFTVRCELWYYDGETCPDPDTVEKIELY